ncbi:hypothetical protein Tco_0754178 [Tanacetum coccineum]
MYCFIVSAIASASSSSEYSWSESRLKSGDLNSSRLRVLKCLLDDQNSCSVSVPNDRYVVSNGSGYAVLICWDEYTVLDRELDTPYLMEVDTPYSTIDQNSRGDDPIDAINYVMSFLTAIVTYRYSTTNNQLRNSSNTRQQATINDGRVTLQPILSLRPNPDNVDNNMINQALHVMPSSEQSNVVNYSETEITSDSNIIPYSQKGIVNANSYSSKNDLKKEESRNIDREIALEQKIKQLVNIVLEKEKAQQLEPKLYDGNVIKNTSAIVIPDSEETLMLAEESLARKDTVIIKLKERIKSLSGKMKGDKIKKDLEEIETINIELDHRVSKLIAENKHLKQTYKQLYDSIKPASIRSKEQSFKNELRKLKGKAIVDNVVTKQTIDPEMLKIDVEPITPKLLNPRTAHSA